MNEDQELLDVLKSVRDYIALQDSEQKAAGAIKMPKNQEESDTIEGGPAPSGHKVTEGTGVNKQLLVMAKQLMKLAQEAKTSTSTTSTADEDDEDEVSSKTPFSKEFAPKPDRSLSSPSSTSEDEDDENEDPSTVDDVLEEEEEEKLPSKQGLEMKSLLKELKKAVLESKAVKGELEALKGDVNKRINKGVEDKLKKMGFQKTEAPIKRLGVDQLQEVRKSDESPININKMETEMAGLSWRQLGQLREQLRIWPDRMGQDPFQLQAEGLSLPISIPDKE